MVTYPSLLDFPPAQLAGYTRESTIDGRTLSKAIEKTFKNRGTPIVAMPEALQATFAQDPAKQTQWQAFTARSQIADAPKALADVVTQVKTFLQPILTALAAGQPFKGQWKALGP